MTEKEAFIAFNLTEQIGSARVGALTQQYGSVVAAWENYPKKVSRTGGAVDWQGEIKKAGKYGVTLLTPADEDYPKTLRAAPGHPLVLYVKGDVKALARPALALVGTRRATPYGRDQAFKFARDLAESGWMILSGLALGIDAEAHKGALAAGGVTVGVIGSGLDKFYPEENRELAHEIVRKGGAVVSEFPFGRTADTQTFPQRNHVVAALASGILAIEAPVKSGTLITTGIALDLGRTVMAVPGRVDSGSSAGCLQLIRQGARLVRNARDVAAEMSELQGFRVIGPQGQRSNGPKTQIPSNPETREPSNPGSLEPSDPETLKPSPPPPPFSIEEAMVMKHVDVEGISVDELVRKTKLPAAKVNSLCMTLRVKGRLRYFPGNRVALPRAD